MSFKLLNVAGINEALYGLGLSFGKTKGENLGTAYSIMLKRADSNAHLGLGHNKYLESIMAWIEVTGSRAFWSEMDTYRMMTKQSDSTMHTLLKEKDVGLRLVQSVVLPDESDLTEEQRDELVSIIYDLEQCLCDYGHLINRVQESKLPELFKLHIVKAVLPETWQQTRVLCVSYKTLQNIYAQRKNHRLYEWKQFCEALKELPHSEWITGGK